MAEVKILVEGYFKWLSETKLKASSTVTLIKDEGKNIIVDTGNIVVEQEIIDSLKKEGLKPKDIDIVVNTHSHSDHRDNNHLFKNATIYVQDNTIKGDIYEFFPIAKSILLAPHTRLIQTPGHTIDDVSVLVKAKKGIYAVVGDLYFIKQEDKPEFTYDEVQLSENKRKVLALADYIVPGHGETFKVKK